MLKAHQACIDLEKGVLRIQGREVRFLSEHELPDKARDPLEPEGFDVPPSAASGPSGNQNPQGNQQGGASFPGGGNTIGSTPAGGPSRSRPAPPPSNRHPEEHVQVLMDLGVSREVAISTLDAAGGNVDVAASLLF